MALDLLFGLASTDHELALLKRIQALQKQQPDAEIFYIVPNHIKFESEINVLSRLATLNNHQGAAVATPHLQIFSLSRLAWFYMQDDPIYRQANLSTNGLVMLVQRLLHDRQDQLVQYSGLLNKQGFISQFAKQILELKQSGMTWAEVAQLSDNLPQQKVLAGKLHDLAVIGNALDAELAERDQYLSSELLVALSLYLRQGKQDLKNHHYYITGYSQMTIAEKKVVTALIAEAGNVTITLPTDDGVASLTSDSISENDLFYRPKQLAYELRQAALDNHVAVQSQAIIENRSISSTYQAVEKFWIDYEQRGVQVNQDYSVTDELEVWETASRFQEIEQIARLIRQEVASGKRRYRDFMLLTRDLAQYENIVPAIFKRYEIPMFMDLDRKMSGHPLIAFLKKLLKLAPHYRLMDIMALLKTELLIPEGTSLESYREALAITENYALAKNITGKRWVEQTDWKYDYRIESDEDEEIRKRAAQKDAQLKMIHDQISVVIAPFLDQLATAIDARSMAQHLYQFLRDCGIKQQLLAWRDAAITQGNLWVAQQPEQVWRTFTTILDDFVAIFDTDQITLTDLHDILQAAFDSATYTGIPATMDQVRLSESGIVQLKGYDTVIIFGATSSNLPATVRQHALLHDGDRAILMDRLPEHVSLQDTAEKQMAQESLLLYSAMMIGQNRLIWTYPTTDGASGQDASTYISRLVAQFNVPVQVFTATAEPQDTLSVITTRVGSPRSTLAHLIMVRRSAQQNKQPLQSGWQSLEHLVYDLEPALFDRLMQSLDYKNQPEQLKPSLVKALFGTNLKTSISKLESYARNPYEFFLQYGLRLQERQKLQLTPAEKGTFMHALLEKFYGELIQGHERFVNFDQRKIERNVMNLREQLLAENDITYDIFTSSARMTFLTDRLTDQVVWSLLNMQRGQNNRPQDVEVKFGAQRDLSAVDYHVPMGDVKVRGKIDRYDVVPVVGVEDFMTVIDYKSNAKVFDYAQTYAGFELQLLTYWKVLHESNPNAQVGAALFWSLKPALIEAKKMAAAPFHQLQANAFSQAQQAGQYRGIILSDEDLLQSLEETPNDTMTAPYAIKRNKNGQLSKTNPDLITSDDLKTLLSFTEVKIKSLASQIFMGRFPLWPYRDGQRTALQFSAFKPVMVFDAAMGDKYHDLITGKADDMLERMVHFANEVESEE